MDYINKPKQLNEILGKIVKKLNAQKEVLSIEKERKNCVKKENTRCRCTSKNKIPLSAKRQKILFQNNGNRCKTCINQDLFIK